VARVVQAVGQATEALEPVTAAYGTAEDETLLGDSRLPKVRDGVLRLLVFRRGDDTPAGLLVQWNCHPEALGADNTLLTADFPAATVAALRKQYGCPVAYFTGAIGGLMAPPNGRIRDDDGTLLGEGEFRYAQRYGEEVARLAARAVASAEPITLSPLTVASRSIVVPVHNPLYRAAWVLGVAKRPIHAWQGRPEAVGEPLPAVALGREMAVQTEVAYLKLGQLHVACIPGELYPELVYGRYQSPVDPHADFPNAPLERPVADILPGDRWLLFGLANDEIGYLIPRRQWDRAPPFCYGRDRGQYGEINSCSAAAAPIVMQTLADCVGQTQGERSPR